MSGIGEKKASACAFSEGDDKLGCSITPFPVRTRSLLIPLAALTLGSAVAAEQSFVKLEEGFEDPPQEAKPWTLWQWMNSNVSKEGITADLEAFKKAGLGGAQSFHLDYGLPQGPVEFNSDQWRDMYLWAAQEAERLGIEIGSHNCGGWSSSGGPWNLPENGMQVVVAEEVRTTGPSKFDAALPLPPSYLPHEVKNVYRDIAVLAFPTPTTELKTMGKASPKATVTEGKGSKAPTLAGDLLTSLALPAPSAGAPSSVVIEFAEPFMAQQLLLTPEKESPGFTGTLESSEDGVTYTPVRTFMMQDQPHRQEYAYQQFFVFPPVTAKYFRITADKGVTKPILLAEAGLSGRLTVDNLPGKALYQRALIQQKVVNKFAPKEEGVVPIDGIIDITDKMDASGKLKWDVPAGDWTIARIGYQPNGTLNHPAPLNGEGLEVDKLSKEAMDLHWAGMMGKIVEKIGPLAGKSFTKVEIDSWEVGSQNWTPKFREEFTKRRGYDPIKFLPVFAGQTVESTDATERFLWDFRRTIADLFAENYVGRLRELSNQNGMKLAVENYGTGPFDDLQYGGHADIPMGVHWMHNGSPQGCTMLAVSAAHTYGHKVIGSEAFTAGETGGNRWETDPYAMKRLGDAMYCAGVNKFIFHAGVMQRFPNVVGPGLTFGKVGSQLSRTVTWWDNGGAAWFRYLARCQFLLQQGLPAADVLVLASEGAPGPTYGGSVFPDVPPGYGYDLCSAEAFLKRVSFKDGKFVMPDGVSYRVLMLPNETVMTLPILNKIKELAAAGGTIIGPKPTRSPSYTGFPKADNEVSTIADALWQPELKDGKGVSTQTAKTALDALKLPPDFEAIGLRPQILYNHRTTPEAEIYFVSNQKYFPDAIEAAFRVTGRVPEIWNPDTGAIEKVAMYREENGRTFVPLRFDPSGSTFVIFRNRPPADHIAAVKSAPETAKQTLKIVKANYGVFDGKGNPRILDITSTKAAGMKRVMTPERFTDKDPAPGVPKHVLAQYAIDEAVHSQAVSADSVLEYPQLPIRFKTMRVLYGELSAAPGKNDTVVDVTEKLNGMVKDGSLSVKVSDELAGGASLPAKPKELRVEYLYNGRWNIAIIPDGSTLNLPGAYETEATPAGYELTALPDNKVELHAWLPGRYEFTTAAGKTLRAQVDKVPPAVDISGPWQVSFPPNLGAPAQVTFDKLISWPDSTDNGVKYFSGTATYDKEIDIPADLVGPNISLELDLGAVKNIAQVFLNGKDLGVLWKPPFRVNISGAAQAGKNTLEIKVTNLWPNRLIGDENLPSDREWNFKRNLEAFPQWVLDGKPSPTGRITFTTAQHWKKDDPLLPSGLLGPVKLVAAERMVLAEAK